MERKDTMLGKRQIRQMAGEIIYGRGEGIFYANEVIEFAADVADDNLYVDAMVQGSGTKIYAVDFVYDMEEHRLLDISCGCPAFYSYDGICKHCVAVLLEAESRMAGNQTLEDHFRESEAALTTLQDLRGNYPGRYKKRETTPELRALLVKRQVERILPFVQNDFYGKVRLEPELTISPYESGVGFKIGVSRMYVVKNVFDLARAIKNNEEIKYGKNLRFTHTQEAFAKEWRPLVEFIVNWCETNEHKYVQSYYGYYHYSEPKLRMLPLDEGSSMEDFLAAMKGLSFSADIGGMQEKKWQVTDESLVRKLQMKRADGGIQITTSGYRGFVGSKYYHYFVEGKIYRTARKGQEAIEAFVQCLSAAEESGLYVQDEDVPAFCREFLPELEKHFICEKKDFDEQDYGVTAVEFEIYLDAPQEDFITCKLEAVYGEVRYNTIGELIDPERRDLAAEMAAQKAVSSYFNAFDDEQNHFVLVEDETLLYELLVEGLVKMQQIGEVYISDALKRINVSAAPKVTVGVSLSGNLLELDMTVADMPKEQLIELLSKYDRKKKYYRLKNGDFINMEDSGIESLVELQQGLGITDAQLKEERIILPKYRALYLDSELKESKARTSIKDKAFKALIRDMKTAEDNDFEIPDELQPILREYQKTGFLWLKTLKANGFGGILADDMGLGKTLQVITLLVSEYASGEKERSAPSLIVAPASLVFNWCSEIKRFAPGLTARMITGTAAERQALIEGIGSHDIVITSYDLLKRDLEHYENIHFDSQVIDEAQFIKNHNTQVARAVKAIQADFKIALTGTPIENKLSELWSIFDYLMPGFFYTYSRFREEMEQPIVQEQDEKATKRLQKMLKPFVLRRLKRDVLKDLPDKIEKPYYAELKGEQKDLYNAHVKRMQLMLSKQTEAEFKQGKIQILSELTRLRQLCCDPGLVFEDYQNESVKAELCLEVIRNAVSGGHKILLFSQFTTMLERLQEQFKVAGITYYSLTGATSKEKRAKLVEQFNRDDTQVFCISLKAGGTGLNLTAADIVIHYDPWWNIAVQNQATDRAHRIGQQNVVTVYKLIVKGTIEEKIVELQERKKELADEILSGEGLSIGKFSKEELLELLE